MIVYTGTSTTFAAASEVGRTSDNYFLATGLTAGVALYIWVRTVDFGGRVGAAIWSASWKSPPRRNGWAKFTTYRNGRCASGHSWRAGRHGGKRCRVVLVQDERRLAVTRRPDRPGPNNQVYFLDSLPPLDAFGIDGDIAIGPDGRVMEKASGTWSRHHISISRQSRASLPR